MAETMCPTCENEGIEQTIHCPQCDYSILVRVFPEPHRPYPDLTKLREVWKEWGLDKGVSIDLFIIGDKKMDYRMRKALLQAVKELLEEK